MPFTFASIGATDARKILREDRRTVGAEEEPLVPSSTGSMEVFGSPMAISTSATSVEERVMAPAAHIALPVITVSASPFTASQPNSRQRSSAATASRSSAKTKATTNAGLESCVSAPLNMQAHPTILNPIAVGSHSDNRNVLHSLSHASPLSSSLGLSQSTETMHALSSLVTAPVVPPPALPPIGKGATDTNTASVVSGRSGTSSTSAFAETSIGTYAGASATTGGTAHTSSDTPNAGNDPLATQCRRVSASESTASTDAGAADVDVRHRREDTAMSDVVLAESSLSAAISRRTERIVRYALQEEGIEDDEENDGENDGSFVEVCSPDAMREADSCSSDADDGNENTASDEDKTNGAAAVPTATTSVQRRYRRAAGTSGATSFNADHGCDTGATATHNGCASASVAGGSEPALLPATKKNSNTSQNAFVASPGSQPSLRSAPGLAHLKDTSLAPEAPTSGEDSSDTHRLFIEYIRNSRKEFLDTYYNSSRPCGRRQHDPNTTSSRANSGYRGTPNDGTEHTAAFASRGDVSEGWGLHQLPPLDYSRIMCPEGEEAINRCINPPPHDHSHRCHSRGRGGASGVMATTTTSRTNAAGTAIHMHTHTVSTSTSEALDMSEDGGTDKENTENMRAPSIQALKNLAAMSYGPFKWGTTRDQCMWICQKLLEVIKTGTPPMMLRALLVIVYLHHFGSREMLAVTYENQHRLFNARDEHWRGLAAVDSPIVSLLYVFGGFVTSLTDFLYSAQSVVADHPEKLSLTSSGGTAWGQSATSAAAAVAANVPASQLSGKSPLPLPTGVGVGSINGPSPGPISVAGIDGSIDISDGGAIAGRSPNSTHVSSASATNSPMHHSAVPRRHSLHIDATPLDSSQSRPSAVSGVSMSDGKMTGNILQQGTFEQWLVCLSPIQRQHLLHSMFELLKGGTTVQYMDTLIPGRMSPVEEYTVATYVVTLRGIFSCVATVLEGYLTMKHNTCFSHVSSEEELSRAQDWAVAVTGYERSVWRLSTFFAWAASLHIKSPVQIPKLRPLPASFLPKLGARLLKAYKGSKSEGAVSAALRHAEIQQQAMPERTAACMIGAVASTANVPPAMTTGGDSVISSHQQGSYGHDSRGVVDAGSDASSHSSAFGNSPPGPTGQEHEHPQQRGCPPQRHNAPPGDSSISSISLAASDGAGMMPTPMSVSSSRSIHPVDLSREFYQQTGSQLVSVDSSTGSEAEMAHFIRRKREQKFMVVADDAGCDTANDVSRFRIFRNQVLGRGSFGTVLKSWDEVRGSFLACKELIMDPDTTNEEATMAALFREYSLLTSLRHPNIVGVVGFIVDDNRGHIFMEWMPSGSIQAVLDLLDEGFRENVVRRFVRDALRGLQYLHSKGIIHRDVKPGNMLLDATGVLKLTDFGSSRNVLQSGAADCATLKTFSVVGTLAYIAPDSVRGSYSFASDIWSLGCSALHMATGRPPWGDAGVESVGLIFKIGCLTEGNHLPTMPAEGSMSPEFVDFVRQSLTFDRHKRPTASELLQHPFITALEDGTANVAMM